MDKETVVVKQEPDTCESDQVPLFENCLNEVNNRNVVYIKQEQCTLEPDNLREVEDSLTSKAPEVGSIQVKVEPQFDFIGVEDKYNVDTDNYLEPIKSEDISSVESDISFTEENNTRKVDINTKIYSCTKCDYTTSRRQYFQRHCIIHDKANARWFNCNLCQFKTVHRCNLVTHTRIHRDNTTQPNPTYSCRCCGKKFNTKLSLDSHMFSKHKNDINVSEVITNTINQCPICDYQTVKKCHLKTHLMTHKELQTDERKQCCESCDYFTYDKSHFKKHLLIHTDDKPYVCVVCGKRFIRKRQVDSHIINHHTDNQELMNSITSEIIKCKLCSYICVYSSNLKAHMKYRHKMKDVTV